MTFLFLFQRPLAECASICDAWFELRVKVVKRRSVVSAILFPTLRY